MTALFLYTRFVSNDKKEKKLILPSDDKRPETYWQRPENYLKKPIFQPLPFLPKLIQVVLGLAFIPTILFIFYNFYLESGFLGFLIFANILPSFIGGYVLEVLVQKLKMEEQRGLAFYIGFFSTMIFLTWYFA